MTDDGLELRLVHRLRAYADGGVRPYDATAIAEAAVRRTSRRPWLPLAGGRRLAGVHAEHRPWWTLRRLAVVAAAGLVIAVAGISLLPSLGGSGAPPTTARPSPSPAATVRPTDSPPPGGVYPNSAAYMIGRHSVVVDGVRFSFRVPTSGWEPYGTVHISKSIAGPQGAEAVIFWAAYPQGADANPCPRVLGPHALTAAELGAQVANADGTEVVSGPMDTTVGGLPASHVVVTVRDDSGCDPGFFYNWKAKPGGAMWDVTEPGDTIRVWVVETDSTLLFIGAETHRTASPLNEVGPTGRAQLESDIREIVDSIEFE